MKREKILVVEDNAITRKMVRFSLEKKGFVVIDAPDGATALRLLDSERPDLVLQDLLLPDLDGFALVEQLRKRPAGAEIPILAFSGFLSKLEEARVCTVGFDDVVTKPIEPSRLVQIVSAHLPARSSFGERFGEGKTLIVADDDAVQRRLVAYRMTQLGFNVVAANDGAEALDIAISSRPDAILADVMMPRLDGFGLCLALRKHPALQSLPLVLVSNSYVETADRELAKRAGANAYVVRTPELREAIQALREGLEAAPTVREVASSDVVGELEKVRGDRVLQQLDRQVSLNAALSQRCAILAAELSVLSGISEALTMRVDIDNVLEQVLAACFDAGGISAGALYLFHGVGPMGVHTFGLRNEGTEDSFRDFFGHQALFDRLAAENQPVALPTPASSYPGERSLLEIAGVQSMLVVPIASKDERLGALVMIAKTTDLRSEDRIAFAQGVASQIALAVTLANVFAKKDSSERHAREQAAVLRSVLESIADGVLVVDERGSFLVQNRAGAALADVSRAAREGVESTGQGLFAADRATPIPRDQLPVVRALRGEHVDRMEMFVRTSPRADGAWMSVTARPLRGEGGAIRGAVEAFRDMTKEKAQEEQLMLSERMASVGTLAAGVAHEINNPLSAIITNLEVAAAEIEKLARLDPSSLALHEIRAELADAREGAERVRDIARDLKVFSRSEDADKRGAVDVHHILDSTVRIAWNEIRHRARLVKSYGEIPRAFANESRLGQVFLNLLVNAAQAIPEGRASDNEIRITTGATAGKISISISDTGEGMSSEVLGRIFTPFFTTKPSGIGTGLGLSICRHIVHAIGGDISVDSRPGKGTTFKVVIPACDAVEPAPKAETHRPAPSRPRRARILVVDDEVSIGTAIGRALGAEHEVVTMTNAVEALERITNGARFDLILCDLMMPTMSGMELHAEISRGVPEMASRFVFLTGGAFTAEARAFLDEIQTPWLEKPFDVQVLRRTVSERLVATDG